MKDNSKRICLWLYSETVRWVTLDELQLIAPGLTESGFKSLIFHLTRQNLLQTQRLEGQQWVSLTTLGRDKLEESFPVFSRHRREWSGKWQVIIFIKAPKGDANFRYLRDQLTQAKAIPLSRGVFLFPGQIPTTIKAMVQQLYRTSVVVFNNSEWPWNEAQLYIGQSNTFADLISVYSGISKQERSLIMLSDAKKGLNEKQKELFCSIFDRLYETLSIDDGITHFYYPQSANGPGLLKELQIWLGQFFTDPTYPTS